MIRSFLILILFLLLSSVSITSIGFLFLRYLSNRSPTDSVSDVYSSHRHFEKYNDDTFQTSKFGSDDVYHCTGSCYCSNDRRKVATSSKLIRNGLTYLVSSVTSLLAIQKAEEYFSKECSLELDSCPQNFIISEVDDCKSADESSLSGTEIKDDDSEDDSTENDDEPDTTDFTCLGRCSEVRKEINSIANQFVSHPVYLEYASSLNNLEYHQQVLQQVSTVEKEGSFELQEQQAMTTFQRIHLHKFCKSNSYFEIDEYKEKFFSPDPSFLPQVRKLWGLSHELFVREKYQSGGMSSCKSGDDSAVIVGSLEKGDIDALHVRKIVCRRVFTKREWEQGVPNENANLRHWKEGYLQEPDFLSQDQVMESIARYRQLQS